jgi:hypothetical protein
MMWKKRLNCTVEIVLPQALIFLESQVCSFAVISLDTSVYALRAYFYAHRDYFSVIESFLSSNSDHSTTVRRHCFSKSAK